MQIDVIRWMFCYNHIESLILNRSSFYTRIYEGEIGAFKECIFEMGFYIIIVQDRFKNAET